MRLYYRLVSDYVDTITHFLAHLFFPLPLWGSILHWASLPEPLWPAGAGVGARGGWVAGMGP